MVTHRVVLVNEFVTKGAGMASLAANTNKAAAVQKKLNNSLTLTQQKLMINGQAIKRLNALKKQGIILTSSQSMHLNNLRNGYTRMGGSLKILEGRNKGFLASMTKMRWAMVNVAMAAALAFAAFRVFLKPTVELETAMVAVQKRTKMSDEAIKELGGDLLDLAKAVPQSASELANLAATAGQLGIRGSEDIVEFTRVVNMMGNSTVLSSEEAAIALGKLSSAFNLPISQVEHLASVINELSNTTAANSKEIISAMVKMSASANLLGVSVDMVAAIAATLISSGMRAERAGTRMNTVFTKMATNAEGISSLFRRVSGDASITAETIRKDLGEDANKVFIDFISHLIKAGKGTDIITESTELFGNVGARVVNQLAGNYLELQKNIIVASDEFEHATSLQEEFDMAMSTTANQWTIFWGNIGASITDFFRASNEGFGKFVQDINMASLMTREFKKSIDDLEGEDREGLVPTFSVDERTKKRISERFPTFEDYLAENKKMIGGRDLSEGKEFELKIRYTIATEGDQEALDLIKQREIAKESAKKIGFGENKTIPEEGKKLEEEYTKAILARNTAFQEGTKTEKTIALTKELEIEKEIAELFTSELADLIKINGELEARSELGLPTGEEAKIESLSEAYDLYVAKIEAVEEAKQKGLITFQEESQEFADAKEDIKKGFDLGAIEAFYRIQKELDDELKKGAVDKYKNTNKELQKELKNVADELSNVKDKMKDVDKAISNILSRKFNIRGISETDIGHLIKQQELELQKAKFATLGLGTAEEFLGSAALFTADSINTQTEAMKKLSKAAETSEDRYNAWRTSLTETIRELLIQSQDIDRDVTGVVLRAQNELLGISNFDRQGGDQFSAMEQNLSALGMAQGIFFGEEQQKLDYSEQLREDRINGMNESAAQAIANLESERSALDDLMAQEEEWINQQSRIRSEIDANREAIERLNAALANRNRLSGGSGGGGGGGESHEEGTINPVTGNPWGGHGMGDFISRPGKPAQIFSPQDTVVGVKDTSLLGGSGGKSIGDVNINIQGYNQNPKALAIEIKRQISSLA